MPCPSAIPAQKPIDAGMTTVPSTGWDPLATASKRSSGHATRSRSAGTSRNSASAASASSRGSSNPSSYAATCRPASVAMKVTSCPEATSCSTSRKPYALPDAPVRMTV